MRILCGTILAAIAAVASGVETQQTNNAARVNERIRSGLKQLRYPFVGLSGYGYTEKHWPLKQLCGKDCHCQKLLHHFPPCRLKRLHQLNMPLPTPMFL